MDHDYRWSPGLDTAAFERRSDAPPTRPQAAAQLAEWIVEEREVEDPPPQGAIAANIALQFPLPRDRTA